MTDRKFTDDDVMKALEVCASGNPEACAECPYEPYPCKYASRDALNLINRQKAEIERLNAVHADMTESLRLAAEANKDMQAEIERLQKYNTDVAFKHYNDGIKEFAERLKANMSNIARMEYGGNIYFCVGYDLIDNLVKEMTETK